MTTFVFFFFPLLFSCTVRAAHVCTGPSLQWNKAVVDRRMGWEEEKEGSNSIIGEGKGKEGWV